MRQSTKTLMAKHGRRMDRAIHNYIYFSFYAPYVRVLTFGVDRVAPLIVKIKPLRPFYHMAVNRYHAKMLSASDVTKVLELKEDVSAFGEKNRGIVPFEYAYKIIFQEPEFIAVMDCPCKRAVGVTDPDILNSCIFVGRKTAQFWLDRCGDKYHARKLSQQEALEMVKRFRERGYITQAFFKVATGGSTGVICNCHVDNCSALRAHLVFRQAGDPLMRIVAESGYSVSHDMEKCTDCGTCVTICKLGGVDSAGGRRTGYNTRDCLGCGLCVEHCPSGALELYRDPEKLVPLDLDIVCEEYTG